MISPSELAKMVEWAAVRVKNEIDIPTLATVEAAKEMAKEAIGTYEFGWQQLAASTQAERQRLGYAANEPLLREGDLRESIVAEAELTPYGAEGVVGSASKIALYQEMGTKTIPPRSFLGGSLMRIEPAATRIFEEWIGKTLELER